MANPKPTNPPAFPGAGIPLWVPGMTLRDYFAGQAMIGILATPPQKGETWPNGITALADIQNFLARVAYGYADAMIAEREKQP